MTKPMNCYEMQPGEQYDVTVKDEGAQRLTFEQITITGGPAQFVFAERTLAAPQIVAAYAV